MRFNQLIIPLVMSLTIMACSFSNDSKEGQMPPSAQKSQDGTYGTFIGAYYLYEKNDPETAETYFALVDSSVEKYKAFVTKTPGYDLIDLGHYYIFVDEKPETALNYFNKAYEFDPSGASLSAVMAYDFIPDSDKKTKGLVHHLESLTQWLPEYCKISERCHNLYYIPVKLAHIYIQPDTEHTDIPKANELLDFAEDILANTAGNLSAYSLYKRLHFYACVKPDEEKYDYWSAKAIENEESNLLPTSCDDPLVPSFDIANEENLRLGLHFMEVEKDYQKAEEYFQRLKYPPGENYAPLKSYYLIDLYMRQPVNNTNLIKAEKELDIAYDYTLRACPEDNFTTECDSYHTRMRAVLYLTQNTDVTDMDKGLDILKLGAKRNSLWSIAELAYFYKCTQPNQKNFDYWQKQLRMTSPPKKPHITLMSCGQKKMHPDILRLIS